MALTLGVNVSQRIAALESASNKETKKNSLVRFSNKVHRNHQTRNDSHLANRFPQRYSSMNSSYSVCEDIYSSCSSLSSSGSERSFEKPSVLLCPAFKMPADISMMDKDVFTTTVLSYPNLRSKSSESVASDDSLSLSSGVFSTKRASLISHSDYETCGSLTSLDDYEDDSRTFSPANNQQTVGNIQENIVKRRRSPATSDIDDSDNDDSGISFDDKLNGLKTDDQSFSKTQEPKKKTYERPAILDQGMGATLTWLRQELTIMRKMDQSLMCQFIEIQKKISAIKIDQQQQLQQQEIIRKQKLSKLMLGEHTSDLLGNHRFSWELGSLDEEDEYYDYDTEDELDDDCAYSATGYTHE